MGASPRGSSFRGGASGNEDVLRLLCCSEQPIHRASLGCSAILTPVKPHRTSPRAQSYGHNVRVGFHKSSALPGPVERVA